MNIAISGRPHLEEPGIREYIERKFQKVFRLHERLTDAQVKCGQERGVYRVDAQIGAPRHQLFVAHVEGSDLRSAVDGAHAKLEAQIRHWKDRLRSHH